MSSFLGAGGASGFNFDLIKPNSSSSGCLSTLTKSSSVSSLAIPTKKARGPRKRPNQSYLEAATVLSAACPNVFSIKNLSKKHSGSLSSLSSSSSDVFPQSPVTRENDSLIEEPSAHPNPSFQFKSNPLCSVREARSPSPPDYDVNSIFGDEGSEGIDSIMGKLSMDDCDPNFNPNVDSYMGCPMGFVIGGNFGRVMLGAHDEDVWKLAPMVEMKDIVPRFNALPSLDKKKKAKTKKKTKKVEEVMNKPEVIQTTSAGSTVTTASDSDRGLKSGLGLRLNHEEVIKAWGDQGFPYNCDSGAPESCDDIAVCI